MPTPRLKARKSHSARPEALRLPSGRPPREAERDARNAEHASAGQAGAANRGVRQEPEHLRRQRDDCRADADLAEGSRHELDARAARERRLDRGGTSAFERLSRRQNGAPANIAGAAVSVPS